MTINIIGVIVICIIAALAWWANEKLNTVPVLKIILQVVIVVLAVLFLLQSFGVMNSNLRLVI